MPNPDHTTTPTNAVVSHPTLRFGMHKRRAMSVYLAPELCDWLTVEARVQRITMSELVNRLLQQQRNLRKDLAALPETRGAAPLFQTLLEQHGEKVSRTMDATVKQLAGVQSALDLLKTMVAHGARLGLTPKQYSQWERDVQDTMKGRPT